MGGEQIYLFDINSTIFKHFRISSRKRAGIHDRISLSTAALERVEELYSFFTQSNNVVEDLTERNVKVLPSHVEELKHQVSMYTENYSFFSFLCIL